MSENLNENLNEELEAPVEEVAAEATEVAEAVAPKVNPIGKAWGAFINLFGFSSKYYPGSKKRKKIFFDVLVYIVLILGGFTMLYPFWWMICASFAGSSIGLADTVFWPGAPTWTLDQAIFQNYIDFFDSATLTINTNVWATIGWTLIYSIVPVVVGVITSASAAFAFAKIEWYGRNIVFFYLLAAIMIPGPSIMVVQYCIYYSWGWTENGLSMIIPGMFGSIMTAFFIRQFLFGLPTSIIEAAKIDGAGYWRIFWGFVLPLALPAIMAQGILSFMGCWNNYLGCYMFVDNTKLYNLPVLIKKISDNYSGGAKNPAVTIAASVISILPILILFASCQNLIIGSLMLTGSKE